MYLPVAYALTTIQARSQAKIPEGAKSFTMKSTRQGSHDGELLYPKYAGCKAKRQRVQLHPLHPSGYGPPTISTILFELGASV